MHFWSTRVSEICFAARVDLHLHSSLQHPSPPDCCSSKPLQKRSRERKREYENVKECEKPVRKSEEDKKGKIDTQRENMRIKDQKEATAFKNK